MPRREPQHGRARRPRRKRARAHAQAVLRQLQLATKRAASAASARPPYRSKRSSACDASVVIRGPCAVIRGLGIRQYVDDSAFSWIAYFCDLLPARLEPHCHRRRRRWSAFGGSPFPLLAGWGTDMTILQNAALQDAVLPDAVLRDAVHQAPAVESIALAPSEPRALIAILSVAKRNALLACFAAGGLHKRDGAWRGAADAKPVSGVTVADLARDGMLTTDHRLGTARLTERGSWFARTLLRDAPAAQA
jgi:hypothetical protein